jgi:urease accessory protein
MNGMSIQKLGWIAALAAFALVSGPGIAQAHVGVGPIHDVLHGLEHPLTGLDHLVAMLAVGICAAQLGGRSIWAVPLSFVSVMALGGVLGMAGIQLPLVEPWIVLSLFVLGIFVASATRLPLAVSATLAGLFALAHGYAHGAEIPAAASGLTYAVGFVLATAGLHVIGISIGLLTERLHALQLQRLAGASIAACGLYLMIG